MTIRIAHTDGEITACYPVMRQLRPHLQASEFLARVRSQEASGYRLPSVVVDGRAVAVAGFRVGENLAWGRFLYVDDLVTDTEQRSHGHGTRLLAWLKRYAVGQGCRQLHLDSGLQRADAHRFYAREGMTRSGFHFVEELDSQQPSPAQRSTDCYAVIFSSQRTDVDQGYADMAARMEALARQQPGFLGMDSARDAKLGITVSYWRDLESIRKWKRHAEHMEAQRLGKAIWYRRYSIRIARVEHGDEFEGA